MKKLITLALFSMLAALCARADVLWQELFNYPNGNIIINSTNVVGGVMVTNWTRHSGTGNDALVKNNRLENSATGSGANRADDVNRKFPAAYTASAQPLFVSFVVNCTNLPNAAGTYFGHFQNASAGLIGKLFALVGTNLCQPNTYRLGVAGSANNPSSIYPFDLALNQDYQVVVEWDPATSYQATLWVNPVSVADYTIASSDVVSSPGISTNYSFRQASSFGSWFCTISNLVVATTFPEASTNVWVSNSIPPSVKIDLKAITNYVGVPSQLAVIAAGQGLADFTYLWQKNGASFSNPNGNSNVLSFASPALSDTGNYKVVVSNTLSGATVSSSTILMWVTNGPPLISIQPTNQSAYPGKTVSVSVLAFGTPPLAYSWTRNNAPITDANVDFTTTNTATLVINNFGTGNTNFTYKCNIVNGYGSTNTVAISLSLLSPQVVTIDTLRGFVDSTFFLVTNTTLFYTVTNAVVYTREVTNADGSVNGGPFTGSANGEFYIQDGTGGVCVFQAGGTSVQPREGDIVNVTGPISSFNGLMEFNLNVADASTSVTVVGHTNTLPAAVVLPFAFTNGSGSFISVSNVIRKYVGRRVTLTNCYFASYAPAAVFASGNTILTNVNGDTFTFFLNAADVNIIGKPIPQFAAQITGPMGYFLSSNTATNRSTGFEIDPSDYADIVAPTPVVGVTYDRVAGAPVLSWNVVGGYTYSVLWSTNVAAPYTAIATGLTASPYSDTVNNVNATGFYKITTP